MADTKEEFRVANWVNIIIALWLILAPFAIGFTQLQTAMWNSIAVGIVMAVVAVFGAAKPLRKPGLIWINVVLGLWLFLSPFLLGFSQMLLATLVHVAMGLLVIGLAAGSAIGAKKNEP